MRRSGQDLGQRRLLAGEHARTAGQRGVECGHSPVISATGRLVRRCERGADHHCVGTARDRLGDVAAGRHAAVGDDVHVDARLVEVANASARGVGDRGRLWYADTENASGGARVTRTDADENRDRARAHEVQGGRVRRATTDDDRELELADELFQVEGLASGIL